MIALKNLTYKEIDNQLTVKKPWDIIIIFILNILLAIPIFIIAHQNFIDLNWFWHIDRIILFIIIVISLQLLLRAIRKIILIGVFFYFIILFVGTILGNYGFKSVYEDYKYMMYYMSENPNPQDIIISKLLPFPNKSKVVDAIEYDNPKVRNFAIMATTKHFKGVKEYHDYFTIIQCFAVFKEINSRWNYVSDPKNKDYIASASESIRYLSGDCDDHSILMASCVKSIGGTARLIHTDGHIYPEILIGTKKEFEAINYLIKKELFVKESYGKSIKYHIDDRGQIWLNLDYTAHYPGGPFLHKEILGVLTLN
ncbi:transglutaminase [Flavobacterium sp.]|uniref:transglutaminase n=1 Tax=Flavobacterium sp. TaxID=239 RepID=UPI0037527A27